ncbi:protein kinase [Rhodococcus sp. 05-2255-3B1]|uniref:type II toxin-antitoxin system HipA family toxin n=1 Tax=unclassified Rhodococcus (in: high G+C Gram-positive bacteria) TaxID=192944 RepID=UPI000B9BA5D3|nr:MULTISPECIES: type II toxin-antitoxin system HipA family toxin [unclassified Rhodococcus (in: high G+C Gram-positive bacteria)]OZE05151.1 protein kinase [Rhodococcus sp. 05-2255-3C]OZE11791.1 protein kinase [Rhodococcus sp. 05-2255-3B1]OZE24198.1 protein kinase [Rhodococcus sp. 05-2255-2A2]
MIPVSELRDVNAADVYKGDLLAGSLTRAGNDVVFLYDSDYLDSASTPDLAWSIPKSSAETRASGGSVPAFFAGLLPEGVRLTGVVTATKTSEDDHFTLLLAVGSDTIGDVRVLPRGQQISLAGTAFDSRHRVPDLRRLFDSLSTGESVSQDPSALPGVQGKVSAQMYSTPVSTTAGPAILKLAPPARLPRLVENESFFMNLARRCALSVPEHRVIEDDNGISGLLVARFDRVGEQRIPQEDACQVSGLYPASKYRMKTEAVIALLADNVERGGGSARQATAELLRLTAYSYAIGNGDLHGKNYSIHKNTQGIWSITPAYDLLCTQPYASWSDPMALSFYGRANRWTRGHFVESAGRLGMPERATRRILDDVCAGVRSGIDEVDTIGFDDKQTRQLKRLLDERCTELS